MLVIICSVVAAAHKTALSHVIYFVFRIQRWRRVGVSKPVIAVVNAVVARRYLRIRRSNMLLSIQLSQACSQRAASGDHHTRIWREHS